MNLSRKQEEIVNSDYLKIIVSAAAASGKTACITERVKTMLARGVSPNKMVVITFTVAAADEMSQRIGKVNGLFIGTVHSYAYNLLCAGGYFEEARKYADEEKFDDLFQLVVAHPQCIKPVEYLVVDEAQDCSESQWEFFELIKPTGFFYCGDARQSIYTWRDAKPERFQYIMYQNDVHVYSLNENYRNGRIILDFAKRIIEKQKRGIDDDSVPMNGRAGHVEWIEYNPSLIPDIIDSINESYGSWFVLTRSNEQVELIKSILDKANIPNITFKRGGKSFNEMNELMKTDKVKVLTIHTAKGLENDNVIVIGTNMWRDEEIRLSYVAATRARERLYWMKNKKVTKKVSNWE